MSHSDSRNLVHCVYSTEGRRNLIPRQLQAELWAFKSVIASKEGFHLVVAGGTENHAHILLALPPTITLARALQKMKAFSSRWLRERNLKFAWQAGYGAFSVSPSNLDRVVQYIEGQEEHHRKRTFEEEFVFLLRSSGVDYDPKFVFG